MTDIFPLCDFFFLSRYIFLLHWQCVWNHWHTKKMKMLQIRHFPDGIARQQISAVVTPHTRFDSFTQYSFFPVTIRKGICVSGWNWTADLLCNPLHYTTTARWYCMTDENLTVFFCVHNPTRVLETTGWNTTPNHYRVFTVFQKWL